MRYPAGRPDDPAAAGRSLVDRAEAPQLAGFLDRTSTVLSDGPDELTMQRHLRAMQAEAGRGSVRGNGSVRGLEGYRVAGVAVAAGFALVATLAGLGSLPAPAQQAMADVANRVGITLPEPAQRAPGAQHAPGLNKQMPTFEPPPGHAVRDQVGRGGFPKPEGRPEHAGPPDDEPGLNGRPEHAGPPDHEPGLEGRDARPGARIAPGQAPDSTAGRTDSTSDRPENVTPRGDGQGADRAPEVPRGSGTPPDPLPPEAPAGPPKEPPAPPADAPAPEEPPAETGKPRQKDPDPAPEPPGESATRNTPADPDDNAP